MCTRFSIFRGIYICASDHKTLENVGLLLIWTLEYAELGQPSLKLINCRAFSLLYISLGKLCVEFIKIFTSAVPPSFKFVVFTQKKNTKNNRKCVFLRNSCSCEGGGVGELVLNMGDILLTLFSLLSLHPYYNFLNNFLLPIMLLQRELCM